MSEPAAPRPGRSRLVIVVVVALLVAALGGGLLARSLLADPPEAEAADGPPVLALERATAAGEDPFTASVTGNPPEFTDTIVARTVEITQQATTDAVTGAAQITGTAPGLYGGSGSLSICDAAAMVTFLAADAAKAAAWAGVLGIAPDAIGTFVAGLTPVVVTADTLVTNHGFAADGAASARQSVLQAGTAVLVDARGLPTVRCACGNPLLPPQLTGLAADAETAGDGWDNLDLDSLVTVTGAAADVSTLTVSDLETGDLLELQVGSPTAGADAVYVATSSNLGQVAYEPEPYAGTLQTSLDGVAWTVALETTPMLDVATGGGLAVAVGMNEEFGGAIHTSTDGVTWEPAIDVIDPLTAVTYGDGTWVAVGNRSFAEESGEGDGSSGAIYRSEDAVTWERVATTDPYQNGELANDGEMLHQSMTSVGYGDGRWIATATECAYRTCMRVLFLSTDTVTWTRMALDERIVLIDLAHDGETWGFVGGEPKPNPANNAEIDFPIGAAGSSPDGVTWSVGATAPDRVVLTGLNPGDGEWLAVDAYVPSSSEDPPPAGGVYRSTDLLTWEQIGTAEPWTTSVALLQSGEDAPVPPAEPAGDPDVGTVRIRTTGLELLALDGTALQTLPYEQSAAAAIEAVTGALGTPTSELSQGDNICSADSTIVTWGDLWLVHPGTDAAAADWWAGLDGTSTPAAATTVDGPHGVTVGQSVQEVRSAHPDAPTESFSYQGVAYDFVYLDVVSMSSDGVPYDLAVEVSGEDGVVVRMHAPVYVVGDC